MSKVAMYDDESKGKKSRKRGKKRVWIVRIILLLLLLLLIGFLILAGSIAWDALFGDKATDFTNIEYEAEDGSTLYAYLAEPEGRGDHPAVLMLHEWWGITEDMTKVADALAAEGYVVLAPDMRRGRTTQQVQRALWMTMRTDQAVVSADIDSALDYLDTLDNVNTDEIGTVGFCFGGNQALRTILRHDDLAASVIFYGTPITDETELSTLSPDTPILGLWGEADPSISERTVNNMSGVMDDLGVENTHIFYEGMNHAFLNAGNYDQGGEPEKAWQEMLTFLDDELGR